MKAVVFIVALLLVVATPSASAATVNDVVVHLCPRLKDMINGTFYNTLLRGVKDYEIGNFNNASNYDVLVFQVDQTLAAWVMEMGYQKDAKTYYWDGASQVKAALKNSSDPLHSYAKELAKYYVNYHLAYVPRNGKGNLGTTAGGKYDLFFGEPTTGPTLFRILEGPVKAPIIKVGQEEAEITARNRCMPMNRPVEELLSTKDVVLATDGVLAPSKILRKAV